MKRILTLLIFFLFLCSSTALAISGSSATSTATAGSGSMTGSGSSATSSASVSSSSASGAGSSSSSTASVGTGSASASSGSSPTSSSSSSSSTSTSSSSGSSGSGSSGGASGDSGLAAADFEEILGYGDTLELTLGNNRFVLTLESAEGSTAMLDVAGQTVEAPRGDIIFVDIDQDGNDDLKLKVVDLNTDEITLSILFLHDGAATVDFTDETKIKREQREETVIPEETPAEDVPTSRTAKDVVLETGSRAVEYVEELGPSKRTTWVIAIVGILGVTFYIFRKGIQDVMKGLKRHR